jgi:hypothetical protein
MKRYQISHWKLSWTYFELANCRVHMIKVLTQQFSITAGWYCPQTAMWPMETDGRHSFAKGRIYPRTSKTPIQYKSHTVLPGKITPQHQSTTCTTTRLCFHHHTSSTHLAGLQTLLPSSTCWTRWRETADGVSKSGLPRHKTVLRNACGVVGDVYLFSEPVQEV